MMPAHRKSPSALHLTGGLKEHPGRYADRVDVVCPDGIGQPPVALSQARKRIWVEMVSSVPEGFFQSGDRMLLEVCTALVAKQRNRKNHITAGEQGLLLQTLTKLGLTSVDRNRVTIVPKKSTEPSPWDDL